MPAPQGRAPAGGRPAPDAARAAGGPRDARAEAFRAELSRFYAHHNPAKLAGVDALAAQYAGRERELFSALRKKYGLGSPTGDRAGARPRRGGPGKRPLGAVAAGAFSGLTKMAAGAAESARAALAEAAGGAIPGAVPGAVPETAPPLTAEPAVAALLGRLAGGDRRKARKLGRWLDLVADDARSAPFPGLEVPHVHERDAREFLDFLLPQLRDRARLGCPSAHVQAEASVEPATVGGGPLGLRRLRIRVVFR
jgi:hypothetical protein